MTSLQFLKTNNTIKPLQIHLTVLPDFKVDGRRHLIKGSQIELLATTNQQQSSLNLVMASFLPHQPSYLCLRTIKKYLFSYYLKL